ncbi:MAG: DNA polymerase III subunit gamma/tau, partial [Proteiniphilum sp.]|nr:DNA polymerase III subunit gamma/tau [Proteiniphilum sp.]
NRITIADTVAHLQYVADREGVKAEPEALNIIAQKADGGMRDALSIFDQTVSYTGGNITYQAVIENLNVLDYEYYFRLSDAILDGNVVESLLTLNDILNRGFEGEYIISGISNHFRDLLVCRDAATAQLFQVGASIRERYVAMAKKCSTPFLYQAIEISNECDLNYRFSKNKRLLLELMLIRLCQLSKPEGAPAAATEKKRPLEPIEERKKEEQKSTVNERIPEKENIPEKKDAPVSEKIPEKETPLQEPEVKEEKKKTASFSGIGVSISSITHREADEATSSAPEVQQHSGANPFSEKELVNAWTEYAANLNEEKLLKNTMTLYQPKMLNDTLFEVEVNTELNKQYLTDHSIALLSFLREKLENGDITMTIRIAEGNAVKKPLTSHEIFNEMVQQNPSLQKLSDEFGLELS